MALKLKTKRIDGYLHRVVNVKNEQGEDSVVLLPLGVEFRPRDLLQVVIGATVLGTPVAFTEEVWTLGKNLPTLNIIAVAILSMIFISLFIYYNTYRFHLKGNIKNFIKRIFFVYTGSFITCFLILFLFDKVDPENLFIGLRRVVLVSFPASMSAAISDALK